MKYYLIENHLYNKNEKGKIEPTPLGFIRIFETPEINLNDNLYSYIIVNKIVLEIYYERISGKYEYKITQDKKQMEYFNTVESLTFESLNDLFKQEYIFKSKHLAFNYVKNLINNILMGFSISLKEQYASLQKEKNRYSHYGKLLKNIKIEIQKQEKNSK